MKKSCLFGLLIAIFLLPKTVLAQKIDLSKYTSLNLAETLNAEQVSADLSNYKENENQITIYMFRGQGCAHCQDFLNYVAKTLVPQYGNYFKLISFETWENSSNATLLKNVSSFLGEPAGGVPYIVIGDKYFIGYGEALNTQIETAIMSLYNNKNRYDVFEEMNKEEKKNNNGSMVPILIGNILVTTLGVIVILFNNNSMKKEVLSALDKKSFKK